MRRRTVAMGDRRLSRPAGGRRRYASDPVRHVLGLLRLEPVRAGRHPIVSGAYRPGPVRQAVRRRRGHGRQVPSPGQGCVRVGHRDRGRQGRPSRLDLQGRKRHRASGRGHAPLHGHGEVERYGHVRLPADRFDSQGAVSGRPIRREQAAGQESRSAESNQRKRP